MPKKSILVMKDLSKVLVGIVFALGSFGPANANEDGIPTEKDTLDLPGGRVVKLLRVSQHETRISLERHSGSRSKVLWTRVYEQEYERLWDQAFFVPVRPGRYFVDLNGDGAPEIGIATWDGGNYLFGHGLLFSVKKRSLTYFGRSPKPIDLVAPTSIFAK